LRHLLGEPNPHASPVLLCSSPARFHLRQLLEPFWPRAVVLSTAEVPVQVVVQSMGVVR
jgi:flagellar biosynthesis protein FlhA